MNISDRGDGFLYNDGMMTLVLNYLASVDKRSYTDDEKYFLLSKEIEFSKIFCHSMICKI